ncbi:tape measure protein [Agathobacter rectalis]|uniref:Phage tail tape measure protein n=1 Tax=Agathobacter rectalis TaxID=39491 RepID=A0A412Q0J9_9FIRM|nr:tape measure protein [Agathobacter rectalis]RGT75512.1 phage tail tape measure protein [Agathobacter rectalis]RGT78889.1 phage tail tape measure protein [Agathobacter rectalis]
MSSIQTGIELNDQFSGVLNNIISSVNLAVSAMYDMQQSMNADIDTSSIEGARDEINQATAAIEAMNQAASRQTAPDIAPPVVDGGNQEPISVPVDPVLPDPLVENPEPIRPEIQPNAPPDPEPVEIPVTWNTDGVDVFTGTGVERFQQEVQSANDMLNTLNTTQARISQTAQGMDILPDAAVQDMNTMQQRLSAIQQRIQQIENNPVNVGADNANAELEQLRMQLNQAIQEQNSLNQAMQNMDVSAANDAYLRLSQTVGNTERYIRDNVDEQGRFNQEVSAGTQQANELTNTIKRAVAAYVSIQSVGKALNISDELVQTTSRLNMMNDGVQTTAELVNMVYAAAQDARGSFSQMADVVARFGNNAKDAFSSSEEVVAFADLIQKQMTIAGASTQEAANAELQLSQALGSGVLRGDELNSIFEQAPNLIQNIADYLDVPIGKIREMAADGELSADVVKAAIFSAADDINSKFNEMPMTWGQIWQSMQNTALIAFQPVLQRLNDLANSEAFQTFIQGAIEAMATLANILLNVFEIAASVGAFIGDNWSIIAPIIYGVIAALGAYLAIMGIVNAITAISAAIDATKAAADALAAGQTFLWTVQQYGLNAALAACPITWIIVLIIALIAIIFAVCNAIAKMTGIANSGFGVITGGVNVVIQFFKNLGLTVANIALGIGNAIAALASNMMTAFHNAICNVQSWFYNLLSTALSVIEGICAALNKLPFVEFDYSGISSAADDYAAKASEAAGNKEDYQSISDAFNEGFTTFDAFQDGWASDAFNAGAAWGDGIADKVSNFSLSDVFGQTDIPNVGDYTSGFNDAIANSGVGDSIGNIDDNTGKIKDSLDVTEEDLKYLRDIAEQEAINRFTTAEINVDMSGMQNTVNSGDDIDGFMTKLTDSVNEAVDNMTEGVHE